MSAHDKNNNKRGTWLIVGIILGAAFAVLALLITQKMPPTPSEPVADVERIPELPAPHEPPPIPPAPTLDPLPRLEACAPGIEIEFTREKNGRMILANPDQVVREVQLKSACHSLNQGSLLGYIGRMKRRLLQ